MSLAVSSQPQKAVTHNLMSQGRALSTILVAYVGLIVQSRVARQTRCAKNDGVGIVAVGSRTWVIRISKRVIIWTLHNEDVWDVSQTLAHPWTFTY